MKDRLKNIFESCVKIDNVLVWEPSTSPFYEAYLINIIHPKAQWSLMLRYTLSVSTTSSTPKTASLWGVFIDKKGTKTVARETFDMNKHDVVHTNRFISIGDSYFSLAEVVGSVHVKKTCLKWEFVFEDPVISLRPFSTGLLDKCWINKFNLLVPRLVGFASGSCFVDGYKKDLSRSRVYQNHLFGPSFTHNGSWVNCLNFKEDSEAYVEAYNIKVPFWRKRHLTLNYFYLCMDGKKFFSQSLIKALFFNKVFVESLRWTGSFKKKGYKFIINIKRLPSLTAGIPYEAPNRASAFCYHSSLANIEIKVYKRHKRSWQYYKTLSAQNKCSFETVQPSQDKDLPLDIA